MPRIKIDDYCRYTWHSNIFKYTSIHTTAHIHSWNIELAHGEIWQMSCGPPYLWEKRLKAKFLLPKPHFDLPSNNAILNDSSFGFAVGHFPKVPMRALYVCPTSKAIACWRLCHMLQSKLAAAYTSNTYITIHHPEEFAFLWQLRVFRLNIRLPGTSDHDKKGDKNVLANKAGDRILGSNTLHKL